MSKRKKKWWELVLAHINETQQDHEARLEALEEAWRTEAAEPAVQLVAEVTKPAPISEPLGFHQMANTLFGPYAEYIEENDVYKRGYL